ncbi:MAG: cupin domain-containing protein [Elusimicrobiota bacterium]
MTDARTSEKIIVEKPDEGRLKELGVSSWPIWTKEPSRFPWHYDDRETCYFLEGEVVVEAGGRSVTLGPGELVTFPRGMDCVWTVKKAVRKHYRFG